MLVRVVSVEQSKSSPQRWTLKLSCGHERRVKQSGMPTRKTERCGPCQVAANEKERK